jgi:REP-associated tyrosine transposase
MSKLRRFYKDGDYVFITAVTYERKPLLIENCDLLLCAIDVVRERQPFEILAQVILPDHWHCIIHSSNEASTSSIIQRIKMSFGAKYRQRYSQSSGRVWQRRYWDHIIRDESDLNRHIDYIHYNPVKHDFVSSPKGWRQSSIHWEQYTNVYANDWGVKELSTFANVEFGE